MTRVSCQSREHQRPHFSRNHVVGHDELDVIGDKNVSSKSESDDYLGDGIVEIAHNGVSWWAIHAQGIVEEGVRESRSNRSNGLHD
jgi:hypothetical protein